MPLDCNLTTLELFLFSLVRRYMSKKYYVVVALVIVAGVMISFSTLNKGSEQSPPQDSQVALASDQKAGLVWYNVNDALLLQQQNGKKLFIDVYTDWCGPCKWMDKNTLSHPVIQEKLDKYFIPIKFNAEGNDTITFNGRVFVNPKPNAPARMSTHEFTPYIASTERGIAYPTVVFINEQLELIQPIAGALAPAQMEPILEFIGSDQYLTVPWEDFLATYTSMITE